MTEGIKKASGRAYKPRSHPGVGKGSHPSLQRVVGPAIRSVPIPDERMGFVRQGVVGVCRVSSRQGGRRGVPNRQGMAGTAQGTGWGLERCQAGGEKAPFPPSPHRSVMGGLSQFFPHILWTL
jgi:hypothetical protein